MTETASSSGKIFRFGLFEADAARNTLKRKGVRVKIHDQPFHVLIQLLENAGEIVSREQLRQTLWPVGTNVDFEGSLNVILKKLRAAIDDDPDNPRFVETVPRRGYRFIAPVSEIAQAGPSASGSPKDVTNGSTRRPDLSPEFATVIHIAPPRPWFRQTAILVAVASLLVLMAGAFLLRSQLSRNHEQKRVMLAILPFENLSNDPNQEYFSDGLTEETITDLGQLSPEHLGVIARTSSMAYKHTNKTVGEIGRELGVDYILEGSVRREGGRARVSAQLIRVSDQTHLWAQNYDRQLNDLLQIQDELGKIIAQQVQINISPQQQIAAARARMIDPEAYDLYLRGRYAWNQRTPAGIKQSIGYFQQATAKDPNFAAAYAGLADAYNIGNIIGVFSPKESLPLAKEAAEKAIQLDSSLAEAHAALGVEKSHFEFDFPQAQKEFLKAIEVNPNSAYAHLFYSNGYLMPVGRVQEAIIENQKALQLDPLSLPINNFMAMTYMFAGEYVKSEQQFHHTIEMDPTFPLAHEYYAALLVATSRYEEAIRENQTAALLGGEDPKAAADKAAAELKSYRTGGAKAYWQRLLRRELQKPASLRSSSDLSALYALVGDDDKAFEWLDRAYDEREGSSITLINVDFYWSNLRSDPRFPAFLRRLGITQ